MLNDGLYKFLQKKCRERRLPIESLPAQLGFSRSSLYRYMKGIVHMDPDVQENFARVLTLDETERREFARHVDLSEFDATVLAARRALDGFIFGTRAANGSGGSVKFAYHENDTYLRSSEEIFGMIRALASAPGAVCRVKLVNCLAADVFGAVSDFLTTLFADCANVTAEHLLTFSETDHLRNTNTLISIIPLLKYSEYTVFYNERPVTDDGGLFNNLLYVGVENENMPAKYFFLTFLDAELSACLATQDRNVYAFGERNYEAYKNRYDAAQLDTSAIDIIGGTLAELQESANCFLIKPNCCYDRVPMSVYRGLFERATSAEIEALRNGAGFPADTDFNACLGMVFNDIERRIDSSYTNSHIDVYSAEGLADFARTGRFTDHLAYLPSFDESERRAVLEYIRGRYADANDDYTLYITRNNILENGYIIAAFENVGVLIGYVPGYGNRSGTGDSGEARSVRNAAYINLLIRNRMLAGVMSDYVKNHVPGTHAMSRPETLAFLDELINSLTGKTNPSAIAQNAVF